MSTIGDRDRGYRSRFHGQDLTGSGYNGVVVVPRRHHPEPKTAFPGGNKPDYAGGRTSPVVKTVIAVIIIVLICLLVSFDAEDRANK